MNDSIVISNKEIEDKIYVIRGLKVMLDRDLAELYGVETRVLNQAVKRNINRFPSDFMFQLNPEEFKNWKSQIVISNREKMGLRKSPLVFTEQGVSMLSSVLNSEKAIQVNIQIMRIFTKTREMLFENLNVKLEIDAIKKKISNQDKNIELVFSYLDELIEKQENNEARTPIGFKLPEII